MDVAILLFDGVTALDAVGPYEVFRCVPGVRVRFVASKAGPKTTDAGLAMLVAEHKLKEVETPDILVVPGTSRPEALLADEEAIAWIGRVDAHTKWTTSVCTGALGLGAAGLLSGKRATTHWVALELLRSFGAEPVSERFVRDGKIVTAAGVSAGIDMALALTALEFGEAAAMTVQLAIEYNPQPPFNAGSPATAPAEIVEQLRQAYAGLEA
ncbi:MAG TPA: DJ-1/PfpI family protein [Roseiflexaceae bacterium]|nr:DJ-1/PfpI family protein [Roseiflexaceae bacterium]